MSEEFLGKAHFTANGEHIDRSPFDVIVRDYTRVQEPVLSFETPSKPRHLYVSHKNGDIFVTLEDGDVSIYSNQGVQKSAIAVSSLGVIDPYGIVVDEHNEVMYITCNKSHKLVKATLDGKLISSVGSKGSGDLQFASPKGLCQDASGNIYVADCGNKRVQVLGPDMVFKKKFSCQGSTRGVAGDSLGTLHVATSYGLESFPDKLVRYSNMWQSCGGIAISQERYMFASYRTDDPRLEICEPDGSLLGTIDELESPRGVFLDQSGYIYIADYEAYQVCKY